MVRICLTALAYVLASLMCVMPASAGEYPSRYVRLVVPWAPGGFTDVMARIVGERLSVSLGQPVIIENKSGASGLIGAAEVAKSAPDGYTFLVTPGELLTTKGLMPAMSFDPDYEIEPVALIAASPIVLVVREDSPYKTVADLVAYARNNRVTFSSPGAGSLPHLAGEWFSMENDARFAHIPYRGGSQASAAVLTGEVAVGLMSATSALPIVNGGQARVLAVMGKRASVLDPSWPTLAAFGSNVEVDTWVGMFAPRGTPMHVTQRITSEVRRILTSTDIRRKMNELGASAPLDDVDGFVLRIKGDALRYAPIISKMNVNAPR